MTQLTAAYRKGRLLRTLFQLLEKHPDGLAAKDAIAALKHSVDLDPSESGTYEQTGQEKFPRLVRFATIGAVKAGWMVKADGTWTVTDEGLKAVAELSDPEQLYKRSNELYREWKKANAGSADSVVLPTADSDATNAALDVAVSLEEDEDAARSEILDYLGKMPPFDFQTCCAQLVGALGHEISWISPPGPDGGLDFVAFADPIGATGRRIKGQAKRQQAKQDINDVGAFLSKLKGDDVGVFIALGGFTKNAEMDVRSDERRVILIDGPDFLRLWIKHYERLSEDARSLLRLRPIWRLAPPVE